MIERREPQKFTLSSAIILRSKLVMRGYLPTSSCMYSRLLNRICRWKLLCLASTCINNHVKQFRMKTVKHCVVNLAFVIMADFWGRGVF